MTVPIREAPATILDRRMRIAVSGASGLIGSAVVDRLGDLGHEVVALVRRKAKGSHEIAWDPAKGILKPESVPSLDVVIHLAGENISRRWTQKRKNSILASRVEGTRKLIKSLRAMPSPPMRLVCASAIGYYGSQGALPMDETSPPGAGFLAAVCHQWEDAARSAEDLVERVVRLRFGVILSPKGGALAKMLPPFRFGFGGVVGDGHQVFSWVSLDDAAKATVFAATTAEPARVYNVVAPNPVTNRQFTRSLAKALGRPAFLPLPTFAARLAFGEMADEMLLSSIKAAPRALQAAGFQFRDPDLDPTLRRLV